MRKLLSLDKPKDYTKQYWKNAAKQNDRQLMNLICDGYSEEKFNADTTPFFIKHNLISLQPHFSVLDIGCGIGRVAPYVSKYVKQYVGIDYVSSMIDKAKVRNDTIDNAIFFSNNGKNLSKFKDNTFDVIFSEIAFQHMKKKIQTLYIQESYRVLKKGGSFIAQIPRLSYYHNIIYSWEWSELLSHLKTFSDIKCPDDKAYFIIKATK